MLRQEILICLQPCRVFDLLVFFLSGTSRAPFDFSSCKCVVGDAVGHKRRYLPNAGHTWRLMRNVRDEVGVGATAFLMVHIALDG